MHIAQAILCMLLAVAISDVLGRLSPIRLPQPFVQILLGVALELAGANVHLPFSSEVFFLVFLAPLLFADALRMPRRELFSMRRAIVGLAVGLVAVTVMGLGYFVDWLAPAVPLAVCCALAAVLSPTDAVAVSALAGRLGMPRRLLHLLRGEALLNDASGVMALRVAIAFAASGELKADQAALKFLYMSLGGLAIGAAVGTLWGKLGSWLSARGQKDPSGQALLTLSIPFVAFTLAELAHTSGILGAVAAGVSFNAFGLTAEHDGPLRLQARGLWRAIEFTLNGLIFVLLGLELPARLGKVPPGMNLNQAFTFPLAILAVLYLARFVWCWIWVRLAMKDVSWRILTVLTLSGVRGAVSLAAVLSLPSDFPARELVIFLATAVILLTLLSAALGLPLVLRGLKLPELDRFDLEERGAREELLKEAERALAREMDHQRSEFGESVDTIGGGLRDIYRYRLNELAERSEDRAEAGHEHRLEKLLRGAALTAQRDLLGSLLKQGKINDSTHSTLERELDLQQASLDSPEKSEPQLH